MLAAICFLLFLGAIAAISSHSSQQPLAAKVTISETDLIRDYKSWTRVNPVPALVLARIAELCADIRAVQAKSGPHADKYITVYVNDVGRHAMMSEKVPLFPQGSMIVKEKLPAVDSSPELLTAMIKREPGYNPQSGDWEYMVLDGTAQTVRERGKLTTCQSCHIMEKDTDYVSRNYLPNDILQALR